MEERTFYVYVSTNKNNRVLYTGVTNNLLNRIFQHKIKENKNSFTAKYNVNKLVYYEVYNDINGAITREKQIKNLVRQKKIEMIIKFNPGWKDLSLILLK